MARIVTFGGVPAGTHTWYELTDGSIAIARKDDEVAAHDMYDPAYYVAKGLATIAGTEDGGGALDVLMLKGVHDVLTASGTGHYTPTNPLTIQPMLNAYSAIEADFNA